MTRLVQILNKLHTSFAAHSLRRLKPEFGIASTGTHNTRPPNCMVLLQRNCTRGPLSHTSTYALQNCLLPLKGFELATTRFDFLEKVKKASNNRVHKTPSAGLSRSNKSYILFSSCGENGTACVTMCCSHFQVLQYELMLPVAANGSSEKACRLHRPLI